MDFNFFGWNLRRTKKEKELQNKESFVLPENQDGAVTVEGVAGAYGAYIDFDATVKNEFELVTRYRELSLLPEVDFAIDDIVNEMIVIDGENDPVKLNLSNVKASNTVKKVIEDEFQGILSLLDWNNQAYEIVKKWYVDGRLFHHIIIDEQDSGKGIQELRYIDPRQIKKIREVEKHIDGDTGAELVKVKDEYYLYNTRGISYNTSTAYSSISYTGGGLKIRPDCVCYTHSGIVDKYSASVLSNLHKAIKPINQLKMMEDAMVIYRIARAPERRIFYVDVGNLPKSKADDYLRTVMQRYRNRLQYNIDTGELKDDRRFMSMLEDYWLPRREGSQGTSIETLPGGENLGEMADVEYFQKAVYRALNVPISRLDSSNGFQLGKAAEISRDEIKFSKFISRLRLRFTHLFDELLKKQLILKNIINPDEWPAIKNHINYRFNTDNHFAELKEAEILKSRLELLQGFDSFSGKYFSGKWIKQNILRQSSDEQREIEAEIKADGIEPEVGPVIGGVPKDSNATEDTQADENPNEDADDMPSNLDEDIVM
jgi:Bacteriophage T4-like portal protein (Gp20)